jgi:hypothetical protein
MSNIDLHLIRGEKDSKSRKTKVICTLGPACWSVDGLVDLIDGGMNVARYISISISIHLTIMIDFPSYIWQ